MAGIAALQDAARRWIDDVLAGSPPARHAGITVGAVEKDRVILHLPFKPSNVTVGKIVHGGIIATLIDVAGASASASGLNEDAAGGATESLSIHFLAAAEGIDLTAEAVVLRRGRRQTVSEVTVRGADGSLVAKGTVTSRIFLRGQTSG